MTMAAPPADEPEGRGAPPGQRRRRRWRPGTLSVVLEDIVLPPHVPIGYLAKTRLIQRAQAGDAEAVRRVWEGNARLVVPALQRLRVPDGLLPDLLQSGQLALPRAIKGFDTERLLEFSTYAVTAIWRNMQRDLASLRFLARLPAHQYPRYCAYRAKLERAITRAERHDLDTGLREAGTLGDLRSIHGLVEWVPIPRDLDRADPCPGPPERLVDREARRLILACLSRLDSRERAVLQWRYGLRCHRVMTLEQIGRQFGLTRERVRQIQLIAEARLRGMLSGTGGGSPPVDSPASPHDAMQEAMPR